jgi:hypothetical protein
MRKELRMLTKITQFIRKLFPAKQVKPQIKVVTITFIDGKMILGCDRCYEVHPEDPDIKAWLGADKTHGEFIAEVSPNRVQFRKKLRSA